MRKKSAHSKGILHARRSKGITHRDQQEKGSQTPYLYGLHACIAALKNPRRTGHHTYITKKTFAKLPTEEKKLLQQRGPVDIIDPTFIEEKLGQEAVHQGILLQVTPLEETSLEDLVESLREDQPATLLLLDQVSDPQNVGAILRSSAAFHVNGLLVQERHSAAINGALAKCASGALEHVPIITVGNLKQSLEYLKESGFWCVGFAEKGTESLHAFDFASRTVLLLGAEGRGLRRLTQESCDTLLKIETSDIFQTLNVSNAAAVALYEVFRQSTKRRKGTCQST